MARPLRLEFAGALYHLTARGNARAEIFADNKDRARIANYFSICWAKRSSASVALLCLLPHGQSLSPPDRDAGTEPGSRHAQIERRVSQAFNRRHGRVGHVFQGRYKSILVDKDSYGPELSRYIVLNPVPAWMVKRAEEWLWLSLHCGFSAAVGLGRRRPNWTGSGCLAT